MASISSHALMAYWARSESEKFKSHLIRRELCQSSSVRMYSAHTESFEEATDAPGGATFSPGNNNAN